MQTAPERSHLHRPPLSTEGDAATVRSRTPVFLYKDKNREPTIAKKVMIIGID